MAPAVTKYKAQTGASLLLLVVGLFLSVAVFFAARQLVPATANQKIAERTAVTLDKVQSALIAFVAANARLPCPANGNLDTGVAAPDVPAATATCDNPDGTIPWATLGLPMDSAFDGWNRKISYRVFNGTTGLTQLGGASMANCDTKKPYSADQLDAGQLCNSSHTNLADQFIANKGFSVSDFGSTTKNVAFALISHGETGIGAWPISGGTRQLPVEGQERENTRAVPNVAFQVATHSAQGVDAMDANHFDDIVRWMSITDLAKRAGHEARNWPDPAPPEITTATTTNMNTAGSGHFNVTTAGGGETITATTTDGAATLDFGGGGGFYANCAWWPTSFRTFNGADRFQLRAYLEFATSGNTSAFGGFTTGFVSKAKADTLAVPFTALCGDTTDSSLLGWGNGTSGNIPAPRFAVEFDAYQDAASSDAAFNHLSVDFENVVHTGGASASICSGVADSYHSNGTQNDCYTGPSNTWLRDGLTSFHRLRLELTPRDPACSGGLAPKLRAWIIPNALCSSGTPDPVCATSRVLDAEFSPATPWPSGVVMIESCVPAPVTGTDLDSLYFGFTASSRNSGTPGSVLYIRNLNAGIYFLP